MGSQGALDTEHAPHVITMTNRETLLVRGVLNVESFDDEQVILETEMGMLSIIGEDLHIRELNLEEGRLFMDGLMNGLNYSAAPNVKRQRGGGLFDRLFR